jgi:hypothetical protein
MAQHVCELLNIGCAETLPSRVRQSQVDAGHHAGAMTEEQELKQESLN